MGDPPRLVAAVLAPANEGKANEAIALELARALGVRKRDVAIVFGEPNRDKRVLVNGDEAALGRRYEELCRAPKLL